MIKARLIIDELFSVIFIMLTKGGGGVQRGHILRRNPCNLADHSTVAHINADKESKNFAKTTFFYYLLLPLTVKAIF